MQFDQIYRKYERKNFDFTNQDLYSEIRAKYRAFCPKCKSALSFAEYHLSSMDYLGACLDCDEDFYACECHFVAD